MAPAGGEPKAAVASGGPAAGRGAAWVLLPAVWCAWLLAWLLPALVVGPRLETPLSWLAAETAPAALAAGAAFFLVAVWPFWPALAGQTGAGASRLSGRWLGRSLAELAILAALAAPPALVAWAVGGRAMEPGPVAAAWTVASALGLGIRLAAAGMGPAAGRWLMFFAVMVCAGPFAVAYGVAETLGSDLGRLVDLSVLSGCVRLAVDGWPGPAWAVFTGLALWPAAAVVLALVALAEHGARPDERGG